MRSMPVTATGLASTTLGASQKNPRPRSSLRAVWTPHHHGDRGMPRFDESGELQLEAEDGQKLDELNAELLDRMKRDETAQPD